MAVLSTHIETIAEVHRFKFLQSGFPSALMQVRSVLPPRAAEKAPRAWRVSWSLLKLAELEEIKIAFRTTRSTGIFQWTPPDEVAEIDCRFSSGSLAWSAAEAGRFQAQLVIEPLRPHEP